MQANPVRRKYHRCPNMGMSLPSLVAFDMSDVVLLTNAVHDARIGPANQIGLCNAKFTVNSRPPQGGTSVRQTETLNRGSSS